MKLTTAAICDYAIVSRDGKLSMMGLFSRVNAGTLPGQIPSAYIAFEIEIPPEDKDRVLEGFAVKVACFDPDEEEVFSTESPMKLRLSGNLPPSGIGRVGQALHLTNTVVLKPGPHTVRIWLDGVLQADREVVFEVEGKEAPESAE